MSIFDKLRRNNPNKDQYKIRAIPWGEQASDLSTRPIGHGIKIEGTSSTEVSTADLVLVISHPDGIMQFVLLDPVNSPSVAQTSRERATYAIGQLKNHFERVLHSGGILNASMTFQIIRNIMWQAERAYTTAVFGTYDTQRQVLDAQVIGDVLNILSADGHCIFNSTDPVFGDFYYSDVGQKIPRQIGVKEGYRFGDDDEVTHVTITGLSTSNGLVFITDSGIKAVDAGVPYGSGFLSKVSRYDDTAYIVFPPSGEKPGVVTLHMRRGNKSATFTLERGTAIKTTSNDSSGLNRSREAGPVPTTTPPRVRVTESRPIPTETRNTLDVNSNFNRVLPGKDMLSLYELVKNPQNHEYFSYEVNSKGSSLTPNDILRVLQALLFWQAGKLDQLQLTERDVLNLVKSNLPRGSRTKVCRLVNFPYP